MATLPSILPADILRQHTRVTRRGPINPLDKCTIVSIFPKRIKERKATIQPGVFEIEAGSFESPSFLVVGPSSWWKNVDMDDTPQPLLEIPVQSPQIADAFVKDYCNGLICYTPNTMPGLFFLLGDQTVRDKHNNGIIVEETKKFLKEKFENEFILAKSRQDAWYHELLNLADALWSNSNGNPLAVSGEMRLAATELGIGGKDWMVNSENLKMEPCPACGALRNPKFPICGSCHTIIDVERYEALGYKANNKG